MVGRGGEQVLRMRRRGQDVRSMRRRGGGEQMLRMRRRGQAMRRMRRRGGGEDVLRMRSVGVRILRTGVVTAAVVLLTA
jgi:hypothetical protein